MTTNAVLLKLGTQLLFADHATDFGAAPATAANSKIRGTPTDIQMDLTGVSAAAFRQSAKSASLIITGAELAEFWTGFACIEHETAPAAGGSVDFWWGTSPSVTAGTGNDGGLSGSDAAYTAVGQNQLIYIGSLFLKNTVINIGPIGKFFMPEAFGSLLIQNNGSTALRSTATAMDETHIVLNPYYRDIQAAA